MALVGKHYPTAWNNYYKRGLRTTKKNPNNTLQIARIYLKSTRRRESYKSYRRIIASSILMESTKFTKRLVKVVSAKYI